MKRLRTFFDKLKEKKSLNKISPIINAADFFFFGTDEVTENAPHIKDYIDIKRYMIMVIFALIPCIIASIYLYGWRVLAIILVSYIFGGTTEAIFAIIRNKKIDEGFLVTGMIFPLILPPTVPLWVVAVGIVFGVFFGKEVFGGTGRNIFNPAIVGRAFIATAFPLLITNFWQQPLTAGLGGFAKFQVDAVTSATPLILDKLGEIVPYSYLELLLGYAPGTIGETFRIGVIIGGILLIITKISDWKIPVSYLGAVVIFSTIGHFVFPEQVSPPLFQLLTGGLLFAAFFMATDPITSPFTTKGAWAFGIGLGFLTVLIRSFTGFVEGVMFSLILMNAITPLLDEFFLKLKYRPLQESEVVNYE